MMVGAVRVPVKAGEANGAKRLRALCVAVEMGFARSWVLSTLPRPTMPAVTPETVPVKVGDARGARRWRAVCVAAEIGFAKSWVLSTFPSPTMAAVTPETVPVKVGDASGALVARLVCTLVNPAPTSVVPTLMVGAVRVPVKVGEARGARAVKVLWRSLPARLTLDAVTAPREALGATTSV